MAASSPRRAGLRLDSCFQKRFGANDKYSSVELRLTCPKYARIGSMLEGPFFAQSILSSSTQMWAL